MENTSMFFYFLQNKIDFKHMQTLMLITTRYFIQLTIVGFEPSNTQTFSQTCLNDSALLLGLICREYCLYVSSCCIRVLSET